MSSGIHWKSAASSDRASPSATKVGESLCERLAGTSGLGAALKSLDELLYTDEMRGIEVVTNDANMERVGVQCRPYAYPVEGGKLILATYALPP